MSGPNLKPEEMETVPNTAEITTTNSAVTTTSSNTASVASTAKSMYFSACASASSASSDRGAASGATSTVDIASGVQIAEQNATFFPYHKNKVLTCVWNPEKDVLASISLDKTFSIWNVSDSPDYRTAIWEDKKKLPYNLTCVDWNNDGILLAVGYEHGVIFICDTVKKEVYHLQPQQLGQIFSLKFNKQGNFLLSAANNTIIWDVKTRRKLQEFGFHNSQILGIEWLTYDSFASFGRDKKIKVCRFKSVVPLITHEGHTDKVNTINCCQQIGFIASGSEDKTLKIWDTKQILCRYNLLGHKTGIHIVKWSPIIPNVGFPLLVSASHDGTVCFWDVKKGMWLQKFTLEIPMYSVNFSHNGKYLAIGSNTRVSLWSSQTGKLIKSYNCESYVSYVSLNSKGTRVGACTLNGKVIVLDLREFGSATLPSPPKYFNYKFVATCKRSH